MGIALADDVGHAKRRRGRWKRNQRPGFLCVRSDKKERRLAVCRRETLSRSVDRCYTSAYE
jgi:hypothetical protein